MLGSHSLPLAMLAGFGFAFAESGLGLGMVVPGETMIVAAAAAVDGPIATLCLFLAVTVGACGGDHVGYVVGRRNGDRLRRSRTVARFGVEHWDRATAMFQRGGASAVFLTRLLPVVRTLTPAAAGSSGLGYGRFVTASLSGSMLWAGVYVGGGSVVTTLAHAAYARLGPATWWIVGGIATLLVVAWLLRRLAGPRDRPEAARVAVVWAGDPRPHHCDLASRTDPSLTP